jgi:diphthine-ammonia ligase
MCSNSKWQGGALHFSRVTLQNVSVLPARQGCHAHLPRIILALRKRRTWSYAFVEEIMRFIALVSGGKDSIYSVVRCMQLGHVCCCLANLHPPPSADSDECDSFTFQTVGCGAVELVAQAMQLPLVRAPLCGSCVRSTCDYEATDGDEVEDLLQLIERCLMQFPDATAVSCGAVLSDYQRLRVENVCRRLKLTCLAPLWRLPQQQLVECMLADGVDAIIVKVSRN